MTENRAGYVARQAPTSAWLSGELATRPGIWGCETLSSSAIKPEQGISHHNWLQHLLNHCKSPDSSCFIPRALVTVVGT